MWAALSASSLLTCIKTFGVPVEYGRGSSVIQINGIYDANYIEVDPNTGAYVMSANPILFVSAADLPEGKAVADDFITVKNIKFKVIEPQPDSEGGIKLILQRTSR